MNAALLIGLGLVWLFLLGGIFGAFWLLNRKKTVLVTGWDDASGTVEQRRLKPDKEGFAHWKNGKETQCTIPLDWSYSRPDGKTKSPHFFADVTPGQGRLIRRGQPNGVEPKWVEVKTSSGVLMQKQVESEWIPMPGDRVAVVVGASHVKEINRSNSLDLAKLLIIGGGILGMLLILVVVALVMIVKVARSTGAV